MKPTALDIAVQRLVEAARGQCYSFMGEDLPGLPEDASMVDVVEQINAVAEYLEGSE